MRTKTILRSIFIISFLLVFLQSCQQTQEYHVMLKVYNLTSTDTIQFGASPTAVFQSVYIPPGQNSTIEVRKIDAIPYMDVTKLTCYIGKDSTIVAEAEGERVVLGDTHIILSFHWNGQNLEFMN